MTPEAPSNTPRRRYLAAACLVLAAALLVSAGCNRGGRGASVVKHSELVDHLSLVETNVKDYSLLDPDRGAFTDTGDVAIPPGALPLGRVPEQVADIGAHGYWAVPCAVAQDGQRAFEVWLFREDWTRIVGIPIGPPPEGGTQEWVRVSWNPITPELAVLMGCSSAPSMHAVSAQVLRVVPQRPQVDPVIGIPGGHEMVIFWAADRLVLVYNSAGNVFRSLDLETGETTVLYEQRRLNPLWMVLPSPDGRFLVFQNPSVRRWPLDLLDLQTGQCGRLAYEDTGTYYRYEPIRWDANDRFRFARVNERDEWDVYVAHLRPPPGRQDAAGTSPEPRDVTSIPRLMPGFASVLEREVLAGGEGW
jgi:hypothetical protein